MLKTLMDLFRDPVRTPTETPKAEGVRVEASCAECGKLTAELCGICGREGKETPICSFMKKPACSMGHSRAVHAVGQVQEMKPGSGNA